MKSKSGCIVLAIVVGSLFLFCFCFITALAISVAQEPELRLKSPKDLHTETSSPKQNIEFRCIKIDEIKYKEKIMSQDDQKAICSKGLEVELKNGSNEFRYVGNPNSDKPLEIKITINFDEQAFLKAEEEKKNKIKEDFKEMYASVTEVYSNYDQINKGLGTNVRSYELYKYFDQQNYTYTQCSVLGIDLGETKNYPSETQDHIKKLKEAVKNYCLYMGEVGKYVMKYNDSKSYTDLSEIETNNKYAYREVINIQVELAEIAEVLGVDIKKL